MNKIQQSSTVNSHLPLLHSLLGLNGTKSIRIASIQNLVISLTLIGALTISAKVQIPFWPVPFTLQTLVVLMIGISMGYSICLQSILGYFMLGIVGVPVFASGAGLAYFTGPTAGYLLGFLCAALLMSYLSSRGWSKNPLSAFIAMIIGTMIIFILGVSWLTYLLGIEKAIQAGLLPFIYSEFLKIIIATGLLPLAWKFSKHK